MKKVWRPQISVLLGVVATLTLAIFTGSHASANPLIYVNFVGLLIVAGGLITLTFVMMPYDEIKHTFRSILWVFRDDSGERVKTVVALHQFAKQQQKDSFNIARSAEQIENYFLLEALELLALGLRADDIVRIFDLKRSTKEALNMTQAGFLLTLAKLGPGLGLVGTLVGLVSLLYQMGQGLGIESIGPSMGIALCATLYGVAISNFILIPLAEALNAKGEKEQLHMRIITDGVLMLKDHRHPVHVRETLRAYLSPQEQLALGNELSVEPAAEKLSA